MGAATFTILACIVGGMAIVISFAAHDLANSLRKRVKQLELVGIGSDASELERRLRDLEHYKRDLQEELMPEVNERLQRIQAEMGQTIDTAETSDVELNAMIERIEALEAEIFGEDE